MNNEVKPTKENFFTKRLNVIDEEFILSWINYVLVLVAFSIFVLLEYARMGFRLDTLASPDFWGAVVTNTALVVAVLFPMTNEGTKAGQKTERYTVTKKILLSLLGKVRAYGHTNELDAYLLKWSKGEYYKELDEILARQCGGLTLRNVDGEVDPTLSVEKNIENNNTEYTDTQKKFVKKLLKKIPFSPVTIPDLYALVPQGKDRRALTVSMSREKFKIMLPKLISTFAWLTFMRAMFLEPGDAPTFESLLYIVLKTFTVFMLVVYAFINSKKITSEKLPLAFDNRINCIKSFALEKEYYKLYDIKRIGDDEDE